MCAESGVWVLVALLMLGGLTAAHVASWVVEVIDGRRGK